MTSTLCSPNLDLGVVLKLTAKQQLTLDFIADYWDENGFSPSIAEIRKGVGLGPSSNNTVIFRLNSLEKYGLIQRNKKTARTIKLTDLGKIQVSQAKKTVIETDSTDLRQDVELLLSNINNIRKDNT